MFSYMTISCRLILFLSLSLLIVIPGDADDDASLLEVDEDEVIGIVMSPIKKNSFPCMDSKTCNEECSPRIIAELYDTWDEDTMSLEDPPFSPILYWRDKNRDPISYLESTDAYDLDSWTCGHDLSIEGCLTLAWYMENCKLSNPLDGFTIYTDGAEEMGILHWSNHSCANAIDLLDATILEEDLPFFEGRVNGTVVRGKKTGVAILIPDPNPNISDSCWSAQCFYTDHDYRPCLEDAQLGLVEVSLETFVEIKDVYCE